MFWGKKGTSFKIHKRYLFIQKRTFFEQKRGVSQKAPNNTQFENVPQRGVFFIMRIIITTENSETYKKGPILKIQNTPYKPRS